MRGGYLTSANADADESMHTHGRRTKRHKVTRLTMSVIAAPVAAEAFEHRVDHRGKRWRRGVVVEIGVRHLVFRLRFQNLPKPPPAAPRPLPSPRRSNRRQRPRPPRRSPDIRAEKR